MKKLLISGFVLIILSFAPTVFAAGATATITQGTGYTLRLSLTSQTPVNAFDLEFSYPADVILISGVDTSHSIVTVLPNPIETANGKLIVRGGSNQAFSGQDGEIVTLYVKPLKTGTLQFTSTRARVFSADGKGTPEDVVFSMNPIAVTAASIARYSQEAPAAAPTDSIAPNLYPLAVVENPIDPATKLLVMTAQDSQSGVGAILVRTKSWLLWSPWQKASNPYPLEGNEWEIQVAAFDNVGNRSAQTFYRLGLLGPKLVVIILAIVVGLGIFWRIHRKKRTAAPHV